MMMIINNFVCKSTHEFQNNLRLKKLESSKTRKYQEISKMVAGFSCIWTEYGLEYSTFWKFSRSASSHNHGQNLWNNVKKTRKIREAD